MNPLKEKIAAILNEGARHGLELLDKNSPCARALKKIDIDKALKEDINRICQEISFIEMTRLISLYARLQMEAGQKREAAKEDLKKIALETEERIERESGAFNIPKQCRSILLDL